MNYLASLVSLCRHICLLSWQAIPTCFALAFLTNAAVIAQVLPISFKNHALEP